MRPWKHIFDAVCILVLHVSLTDAQCTFPADMDGVWHTSMHGTWTVNGTHIENVDISEAQLSTTVVTFTCFNSSGTLYVIESETFVIFNKNRSLYTCLDIQETSSTKFIYYRARTPDSSGSSFILGSSFNFVCDRQTALPSNHHVAVKNGSETAAASLCPADIFGTYSYACAAPNSTANETQMDVCTTRTELIFNYNACSTEHMFSKEGYLDCIYHASSGSTTYLTVYNRDSVTPDGINYYLFTCLAIELNDSTVYTTYNPKLCDENQNASSIASPGQAISFCPIVLCPITTVAPTTTVTEAPGSETDLLPVFIALGVILGLLLIAAIVLLIIFICLRKRRKKKEDEEKQLTEESSQDNRSEKSKDEDQQSIDSGISEPPGTGRTTVVGQKIIAVGDLEFDYYKDHPGTPKNVSRMSDLPPSTLPPEDDESSLNEGSEDGHDEEQKEEQNTDKEEGSDKDEQKKDEKSEGEGEEEVKKEASGDEDTKDDDGQKEEKEEDEEEQSQKGDEEEKRRGSPDVGSEDEEERHLREIGIKSGHLGYVPTGPLSTVLITREEDERRRNRIKGKNKKKRMKKLARRKKQYAPDDVAGSAGDESGFSSDEELAHRGPKEAPFLKQYHQKKYIEHVLDEQNYWGEEKPVGGVTDFSDMESSFPSEEGSSHGGRRSSDVEMHSDDQNEALEGTKTDEKHVNIGGVINDYEVELSGVKTQRKGSSGTIISDGTSAKLIIVKEHVDEVDKDVFTENQNAINEEKEQELKKKKSKRRSTGRYSEADDNRSASDMDLSDHSSKSSEADSGVEDVLDVFLTGDQQKLVVNILFDEEENLRPEFDRDVEGRVIRRMDGTVIYDPKTGRFTMKRKHKRLFHTRRLQRNRKGRPTGGYKDDEYGPDVPEKDEPPLKGSQSITDTGSVHHAHHGGGLKTEDLKRYREDTKTVGFAISDDVTDITSFHGDYPSDYKRKGRRDVGSALRRKLHSRLFKKRKKHNVLSQSESSSLPEVRRGWTNPDMFPGPEGISRSVTNDSMFLPHHDVRGDLNPLRVSGRPIGSRQYHSTPIVSNRRHLRTPGDAQMYREGLESDKRILSSLQKDGQHREAFMTPDERFDSGFMNDDFDDYNDYTYYDSMQRSNTYWSESGKFIAHEKGCPDLNNPTRLFTIVNRPEDLEEAKHEQRPDTQPRAHTSEPNLHHSDMHENEFQKGSESSIAYKSTDYSTNSRYIDDYRLRQLLEELYKDKKYFDQYMQKTELNLEPEHYSRGLAEHGREYLLERAGYWEERGPLPPRPPQTAIGFRMSRLQTAFPANRRFDRSSTGTLTPDYDMRPNAVPGVVNIDEGNESQA